jgi:ABC-type multidrug transport system fused ATPase/permease subunit
MTGQLAMLLIASDSQHEHKSWYIDGVPQNLNNIENASIAVSRIHEIASLPKEQGPNEFPGKEVSSEKSDSSAAGSVVFENVRLQYGLVVLYNLAFADQSLHLEPNSRPL